MVALFLTLLKPQLHFFQDWSKGNGTLEAQIPQIKPTHPPVGVSENSFPEISLGLHPQHSVGKGIHYFPNNNRAFPSAETDRNNVATEVRKWTKESKQTIKKSTLFWISSFRKIKNLSFISNKSEKHAFSSSGGSENKSDRKEGKGTTESWIKWKWRSAMSFYKNCKFLMTFPALYS